MPTAKPGRSYESLRQTHQARLAEIFGPSISRLGWSTEQLREARQQQLRTLLRHAVERSAWHRPRLSDIDIDNMTEEDLKQVPPMTKGELMANWDEIVADPRLSLASCEAHLDRLSKSQLPGYLEEEFHVVASGGSSGKRGVFVYGWDDWAWVFASMNRWFVRGLRERGLQLDSKLVAATVGARSPTHSTAAAARTFGGGAASFSVSLPLAEIVGGLNRLQPSVLFVYSSALALLVEEAEGGRLKISPDWIWSTAEPLLPQVAEAAERIWGSPPVNAYGTSDVGIVGAGCGMAPGIHLSDDIMIVEPVDEVGRPVGTGERAAKLYATPLLGHTLPLIRYELTDEVMLLENGCPCGSAFRRIEDVQGRLDDCFTYSCGRVVHPHVFRSHLSRTAGILEYQVRQTDRGAEVLLRCNSAVSLPPLRRELQEALRSVGLAKPEVELRTVQSIDRVGIGKLKRFVPLTG